MHIGGKTVAEHNRLINVDMQFAHNSNSSKERETLYQQIARSSGVQHLANGAK